MFYRIHLTVTNSAGLTHKSIRDVLPRTATMSLGTSPAGLEVTLDGQPVATPNQVVGVVGMTRMLGLASPQTIGGRTYEFVEWSDAGNQLHSIVFPASDTGYVANFREIPPPSQPTDRYLTLGAADGVGDHVYVANTADLTEGGAFTVSLWARTPVTGVSMYLLAKGKSGFEQWVLRRVDSNNRFIFNVREQTSNTMIAASSPANYGTDGQWHHYAGVYDPVAQTVRLYLDGSDAATTVGTIDEPMRNDDEALCLGARSTGPTGCATSAGWRGDIDDVGLWNRALSAAEIQASLQGELTGTEAGLVAYWTLNEGTGQTAADRSPSGLVGQLGASSAPDPSDPAWVALTPSP